MRNRISDDRDKHGLSAAPDNPWPLSATDAAARLNVSERTVRRAIARGDLPASKHAGVYRIAFTDLLHYAERRHGRLEASTAAGAVGAAARLLSACSSTPLIGRETDHSALQALILQSDARVVSLLGPGGVGKTRLALDVVAGVARHFADGAVFVDLSPVRDSSAALVAVAHALGIRGTSPRSITTTLRSYLRSRQVLLVLDNCEHLLPVAREITALAVTCPAVQVLATSRVALNLRDEYRFPVAPLPTPSASESDLGRLVENSAIRLYLQRARMIQPDYAPDAADLLAIAEICRRLDGLPLAIELAAARHAALSPRGLLARISDRLALLSKGPIDLPARQRTMRATIAWSCALLDADARALLSCLAVFEGGFDLDAVRAVSNRNETAVIDLVESLVTHNLVQRDERGAHGDRFRMLETVREFARECLRASGEEQVVQRAHALHFVALAETLDATVYGPEMRPCLDRYELEYPNFRAALATLTGTCDAAGELRLAAALSAYWGYRGVAAEGVTTLQAALDRGRMAPAALRGRAMAKLGAQYWLIGDIERAVEVSDAGLPLVRSTGDVVQLARSLFFRSVIVSADPSCRHEVIAYLQEAIDLTRGLQPHPPIFCTLLGDLGRALLRVGEQDHGVAMTEECLALARATGRHLEIGMSLLTLGSLDRQTGNAPRAAARLSESLKAFRESGVMTLTSFAIYELVGLVAAGGRPEAAARMLGVIDMVQNRSGAALDDLWKLDQEAGQLAGQAANTMRRALTDETIASARRAGRLLSLDQAITEACASADAIATASTSPSLLSLSPAPAISARLSARERDVLQLLLRRLTAAEIAEQLFVSPRTVEHHIASIYNKLGVGSRRDAIAAAVRLELA